MNQKSKIIFTKKHTNKHFKNPKICKWNFTYDSNSELGYGGSAIVWGICTTMKGILHANNTQQYDPLCDGSINKGIR